MYQTPTPRPPHESTSRGPSPPIRDRHHCAHPNPKPSHASRARGATRVAIGIADPGRRCAARAVQQLVPGAAGPCCRAALPGRPFSNRPRKAAASGARTAFGGLDSCSHGCPEHETCASSGILDLEHEPGADQRGRRSCGLVCVQSFLSSRVGASPQSTSARSWITASRRRDRAVGGPPPFDYPPPPPHRRRRFRGSAPSDLQTVYRSRARRAPRRRATAAPATLVEADHGTVCIGECTPRVARGASCLCRRR